MKLQLVKPSRKYRESFLYALGEFRREGLPWWAGVELDTAEKDFDAFVAMKLAEAGPFAPAGPAGADAPVPKTHRWAVAEHQFVGRISIHHRLNDALRRSGGHIGYDTVPSQRGNGIASEMLRQALPLARGLGLTDLLFTCDDTNIASCRVIEQNGGALHETKPLEPGAPLKRYYWIKLPT